MKKTLLKFTRQFYLIASVILTFHFFSLEAQTMPTQAYPSTSTFWVCGGSGIVPTDSATLAAGLTSYAAVINWEAYHCDWAAFGGLPYHADRSNLPVLSYMYTGAIGLRGFVDWEEIPFREYTIGLGHNWESFFLHYDQDTWLDFHGQLNMPNALYEDSAVWAGVPAGVGYTTSLSDTKGVVLQDSGRWTYNNDIFQGGASGGFFYIVNPEQFGEFKTTLARNGVGGHMTIQYSSAVDANYKVTSWKTLTITTDGTSNFTHGGRVSWTPPSDWVWGKNPTPKMTADSSNYGHWLRISGLGYSTRPLLSSLSTRTWMILDATHGGQLKNPGWDARNDRNGDGYVEDNEYPLLYSSATARFQYEARVGMNTPGFGIKWMPCMTNTANPQYQTDVANYYQLFWSQTGWNGGYNDNFFLNLNKWFFPVATGGTLINQGAINGRVQDASTNLLFSDNFTDLLKKVKKTTGTAWMGANTYFINPYDYYDYAVPYPALGKYALKDTAFSYLLLEGTIYDSWSMIDAASFLGRYTGMGCIWQVPALAKAGVKTGIMARIGDLILKDPPFVLSDSVMWNREEETLLAQYYLYNLPGYTSFQDILGSNTVFPLLTTNNTYYKPGVPASYAYQPHKLLAVNIGTPISTTIPSGYKPMPYLARVSGSNNYNNTIIGNTLSSALHDTAYSFTDIPVLPTGTYYLDTMITANYTTPGNYHDSHGNPFPAEVVLARQYTSGMVVFRTPFGAPTDYHGYTSDANVDTIKLPGYPQLNYQIVGFNGNLSVPVNKVIIHGFEGLVLKKVTSDRLASIVETSPSSNVLVYPNPFSKQATVALTIEQNADVQMVLYNSIGQEVSTIENKHLAAGSYTYQLNAENKGFYFLRSVINGVPSIQKLMQVE